MMGPHLLQCIAPAYAGLTGYEPRLATRENPPDGVAVLDLAGRLTKPFCAEIRRELQELERNDAVSEVLAIVDSPGGTVAGTQDLHTAVSRFAERKRLVVAAEDLCASAAYYGFCGASEIYINPAGGLGSIGVYTVVEDASELLKRQGVAFHVIRSGKHKGARIWGAELTKEQIDEIQAVIDAYARLFMSAVAHGRKMTPERVRDLADGRLFIGEQAVAAGLADGVATPDEVLAKMAGRVTPTYAHLRGARAAEQLQAIYAAEYGEDRSFANAYDYQREAIAKRYPQLTAAAAEHEREENQKHQADAAWRRSLNR